MVRCVPAVVAEGDCFLIGEFIAVPTISNLSVLALKRTTLIKAQMRFAVALLNKRVVVRFALALVVVAVAVATHRH